MKTQKILAIILVATLSVNSLFAQSVFASSKNTNIEYNLYDEEKNETVNIDGVNYTYKYTYKNGNRVTIITNDTNNNIEELLYDESSSNMYLNGELITTNQTESTQQQLLSSRAYYVWQTLSSDSSYISWGKATTAAVLAGMIATALGSLGAAGVIAAMGTAALGVIAAQTSGGTVYNTLQMYTAPFMNPQYRTVWGFKAGTGDYYGDYIYNW